MSFIKILSFLPDAFTRIDRSQELTRKRSSQTLQSALLTILQGYEGQYEVSYQDGVVTIFSSSSILKYYIHQNQERIIHTLQESLPRGDVQKLVFKGPRQ